MNGPQGNQRAVDAYHAGPGYNYAVNQSLDGVARSAAARGADVGGNTLAALSDRAGNMANQEYGGWVDRLRGYVAPELAATGGQASAIAGKAPVYTNTAGNIAGLGTLTAKGLTDQNTQAANAAMAGSGNLWKLGLSALTGTASAAGLPGGTSLLGGGGGGGQGPIPGGPGGPVPFFG